MKFAVINLKDFSSYVPKDIEQGFLNELSKVLKSIEEGRQKDGKKPFNNYLVINQDEPYIEEVFEVLKKNHQK
ncbi:MULTISPECIES: hypothetical protein [Bacillus]|uniref:hypothetical protein n=1 Tax=Bacillus TaxID=1386 RepID=UPI000D033166|nr:hypothetical protein [Bacillus pumilus]MBU8576241.1 hypothetical protein [Bacillus pumilus]MCY7574253.1 hypothetical protein [Bacillus pumilus]MEC3763586.1 hypothetical protein [Bacillus pumilus]PRS32140.1 hypothetical protein C6X96_12870 [Bacillus pumilus]